MTKWSSGVRSRFEIPEPLPPTQVPGEVRRHLFLAIKEALNNVVKHAHASEVVVRLQLSKDQLQFTILDNGAGFDSGERAEQRTRTSPGRNGNGLHNLRERLSAVSGEVHVQSQPGQGTVVRIHVPLAVQRREADSHLHVN